MYFKEVSFTYWYCYFWLNKKICGNGIFLIHTLSFSAIDLKKHIISRIIPAWNSCNIKYTTRAEHSSKMCSLLQTPSTAIFTKWAVPQIMPSTSVVFILIDWYCLFVSHPYVQCSCILYLGYLTDIFIGRVWYREEKF